MAEGDQVSGGARRADAVCQIFPSTCLYTSDIITRCDGDRVRVSSIFNIFKSVNQRYSNKAEFFGLHFTYKILSQTFEVP